MCALTLGGAEGGGSVFQDELRILKQGMTHFTSRCEPPRVLIHAKESVKLLQLTWIQAATRVREASSSWLCSRTCARYVFAGMRRGDADPTTEPTHPRHLSAALLAFGVSVGLRS